MVVESPGQAMEHWDAGMVPPRPLENEFPPAYTVCSAVSTIVDHWILTVALCAIFNASDGESILGTGGLADGGRHSRRRGIIARQCASSAVLNAPSRGPRSGMRVVRQRQRVSAAAHLELCQGGYCQNGSEHHTREICLPFPEQRTRHVMALMLAWLAPFTKELPQ